MRGVFLIFILLTPPVWADEPAWFEPSRAIFSEDPLLAQKARREFSKSPGLVTELKRSLHDPEWMESAVELVRALSMGETFPLLMQELKEQREPNWRMLVAALELRAGHDDRELRKLVLRFWQRDWKKLPQTIRLVSTLAVDDLGLPATPIEVRRGLHDVSAQIRTANVHLAAQRWLQTGEAAFRRILVTGVTLRPYQARAQAWHEIARAPAAERKRFQRYVAACKADPQPAVREACLGVGSP